MNLEHDPTRRQWLAGAGAVGVWGLEGEAMAAEAALPDVYAALGVQPVLNAAGTFTNLGGSRMPPEVARAWLAASRQFVDLAVLQDKVGQRIAQLIGVESALVTSGAAGAMLLATAAVMTGGAPDRVRQLPDPAGMKHEVVVQKAHASCYDQQVRACGARLIEVESQAELEQAIGPRTALLLFYNYLEAAGPIRRADWLALARKHRLPTLLDAAADVPPLENLAGYVKQGFDLVAFSGGKALRGPNDAGLLLGKKDWIEAAQRCTNPHCPSIGRPLKVGKEDMVAMWAAVERFVKLDHQAEWQEWERRLGIIETAVKTIPTVTTERIVPPIANQVPHVIIDWDPQRVKATPRQISDRLGQGNPPIRLGRVHGTGSKGLLVSVFLLEPAEVEIVARRLRDALQAAAS